MAANLVKFYLLAKELSEKIIFSSLFLHNRIAQTAFNDYFCSLENKLSQNMMQQFKRWNNRVGWAVFAIATLVYLLTMEPVSSIEGFFSMFAG